MLSHMVTHVVMFRFRDRSPEHLDHCRELLEGLPAQVPQIRHLEVGLNRVTSDRAFDLCLYSRFDSFDDLAEYQIHPAHVEVATYLRSAADSRGSVDYES
jgi:Stress responsive A/B Barrel Domain